MKFKLIDKLQLQESITENNLYIIGNGFDLHHGVKSSYYDFEKTIGKNSPLRAIIETYIKLPKNEIWGNFEDALAHIDRGLVIRNVDDFLYIYDVKEVDHEDFKWSDFGVTIDSALQPLEELLTTLPRRFKTWIQALELPTRNKPLINIINPNAKFINFNYTEFLESLYNIKKDNILYIHGDRRIKKAPLVLGHGRNAEEMFDKWWEANKKIKIRSNDLLSLAYFYDGDEYKMWKSQVRYEAAQAAIDRIEDYYSDSAKKTKDVLIKNKNYFNELKPDNIIILGHSLSPVDYLYFEEIIEASHNAKKINWYISFYNNDDIKRINNFAEEMNINRNQIKLFKL